MKSILRSSLVALTVVMLFSCNTLGQSKVREIKLVAPPGKALAVFAEGCFWCSEHIFEAVAGVDSAVSGYAGGHTRNPTYEQVCAENTGHAESVLVYYNPKVISYAELLDVFFTSHDPTTLNQQGPDIGTSYRSAIFTLRPGDAAIAREAIKKYTPQFPKPIVTEVKPITAFYRAEEYHQNYVEYNPSSGYVQSVSLPRFDSFKRACKLKMKK